MSSRNTTLTGIEGLDKILTGFPRGGLLTVAGNPGTGKTALAGQFIYKSASKHGEPGVYASFLEDEDHVSPPIHQMIDYYTFSYASIHVQAEVAAYSLQPFELLPI